MPSSSKLLDTPLFFRAATADWIPQNKVIGYIGKYQNVQQN
jgi:hypothetical protein